MNATTTTTQEQISDLETQIGRLKDEKRAAEKDANDAKVAAENLAAKVADAEAKAEAADAKVTEVLAEAKAHADALEDAQTRAGKAEDEAAKAVAEAAHVNESLAAEREENAALKAENEGLVTVNGRLQAALDAAQPKLDALATLLSVAGDTPPAPEPVAEPYVQATFSTAGDVTIDSTFSAANVEEPVEDEPDADDAAPAA